MIRAVLLVLIMLAVLTAADISVAVNIVAFLLVVLPTINLLAAVLLWRASRRAPDIVSLNARARDAVVLWVAASAAGLLGINRLTSPFLSREAVTALLLIALLLVSIPAVDWVWTWRREWAPERVRRALGWHEDLTG